jgi:hypothetical protein
MSPDKTLRYGNKLRNNITHLECFVVLDEVHLSYELLTEKVLLTISYSKYYEAIIVTLLCFNQMVSLILRFTIIMAS